MPTNTFVADTPLDEDEINANIEQARSRYASAANYGVGTNTRPHSYQQGIVRISPDLAGESFTWRQNGLGRIDITSTGAYLIMGDGSSFSAGTPVLTLTCIESDDVIGPDPVVWTFSPGGSSTLFSLDQGDASLSAEPNLLLPGFAYKLALTNTGSPGSPDFCEFGLVVQGYPVRGGGL